MNKRIILLGPAALIGIALFAFLGGFIVKWLWNWLTPPLFGWPTITFWQAFAMLALTRILFGGLGLHNGGGRHSKFRGRMRKRIVDRISERLGEHWDEMTPEEREHLRDRLRERFGFDPAGGESKGT